MHQFQTTRQSFFLFLCLLPVAICQDDSSLPAWEIAVSISAGVVSLMLCTYSVYTLYRYRQTQSPTPPLPGPSGPPDTQEGGVISATVQGMKSVTTTAVKKGKDGMQSVAGAAAGAAGTITSKLGESKATTEERQEKKNKIVAKLSDSKNAGAKSAAVLTQPLAGKRPKITNQV